MASCCTLDVDVDFDVDAVTMMPPFYMIYCFVLSQSGLKSVRDGDCDSTNSVPLKLYRECPFVFPCCFVSESPSESTYFIILSLIVFHQ